MEENVEVTEVEDEEEEVDPEEEGIQYDPNVNENVEGLELVNEHFDDIETFKIDDYEEPVIIETNDFSIEEIEKAENKTESQNNDNMTEKKYSIVAIVVGIVVIGFIITMFFSRKK